MTDKEKTIKGLRDIRRCCAMGAGMKGNYIRTVDKAIDLLEEEPRRPIILHETESYKDGKCPFCTFPVDTILYPHYCGKCRQLLKWEEDDA